MLDTMYFFALIYILVLRATSQFHDTKSIATVTAPHEKIKRCTTGRMIRHPPNWSSTTSRARLYSLVTTRTRRVRSSLPPGLGAIHASVSVVTPRINP